MDLALPRGLTFISSQEGSGHLKSRKCSDLGLPLSQIPPGLLSPTTWSSAISTGA